MFWKIWMMVGCLLEMYAIWAIWLAVRENRKGDNVTIDMSIPGQKHYYEWLSGGAEKGELLEAAVLDTGFTEFYRLKVRKNQIMSREKIDTVAFCLQSKDFPPFVKLMRENGKVSGV
ncbi:MAG: hypothetical protein ACOX6P_11385 [Candidatus Merdivicinus sp.]